MEDGKVRKELLRKAEKEGVTGESPRETGELVVRGPGGRDVREQSKVSTAEARREAQGC